MAHRPKWTKDRYDELVEYRQRYLVLARRFTALEEEAAAELLKANRVIAQLRIEIAELRAAKK